MHYYHLYILYHYIIKALLYYLSIIILFMYYYHKPNDYIFNFYWVYKVIYNSVAVSRSILGKGRLPDNFVDLWQRSLSVLDPEASHSFIEETFSTFFLNNKLTNSPEIHPTLTIVGFFFIYVWFKLLDFKMWQKKEMYLIAIDRKKE